jgi:pimeloyl-ACP methyl ester carboxylesterase
VVERGGCRNYYGQYSLTSTWLATLLTYLQFNRLQSHRSHNLSESPAEASQLSPNSSEETRRQLERQLTAGSINSGFDNLLSSLTVGNQLQRQRSTDRKADPTGLTVLYSPPQSPVADIIFVHGLGGSSHKSWSYDRDPELFWPQKWLPFEPETSDARILTFGYNANYKSSGPNSVSNISDFARALLFGMKFGRDQEKRDLNIGKVPIIFVAHSMGGLVFKRAFLSGLDNPGYKDIVTQIHAVLFLSTPHRGTDLATVLNRILTVSIFMQSPKQYITELQKSSPTIENLNEGFANHAAELQIFSFYETLETPVGPVKNMLILDTASSTLGYAGEVKTPLHANHNGVSKFPSRDNSNYQSVLSALQTLVSQYKAAGLHLQRANAVLDTKRIGKLLSVTSAPEGDYTALLHKWKEGTCESVLAEPAFEEWLDQSQKSAVLWLYGQPGCGKSVHAAFLIHYLISTDRACQFFFFQHSILAKQTATDLLKSLALQIAYATPEYEKALQILSDDGLNLEKADAETIWSKIFSSALFSISRQAPIYWIIDALDESDAALSLLELFSSISLSQCPIRLLITSRRTPPVQNAFDRLSTSLPLKTISIDFNATDIRRYATAEMEYMHGETAFKQIIVDQIVDKARGSFLWVRLAIQEIKRCHSRDEIKQALVSIPTGMSPMYRRMEETIKGLTRPIDISLARMILAWVTYARRPLHVDELLQALKPEHAKILDLNYTINQTCGHFVTLDSNNYVSLIHYTAREHLINAAEIPFSLSPQSAHEELFKKTLSVFLHRSVRAKLGPGQLPPLYSYAATSWSFHLSRSSREPVEILNMLTKFFTSSHAYVLPWIQTLAMLGQLKVLVLASQNLADFVHFQRNLEQIGMSLLDRHSQLEVLELWSRDLLKIVGKFGGNLLQDPTAIYKNIPPFCPRNTQVYRQFGRSQSSPLSVDNLSHAEWDDCLARLSVGTQHQALMIVCSGSFLAIPTDAGTIILWDSGTFEQIRILYHQEHIHTVCFSNNGDMLASYGIRTTKIFHVSSGNLLHKITNVAHSRALCMTFAQADSTLLVGLDVRKVVRLVLDRENEGWKALSSTLFREELSIEGTVLNSPTAMAFNNTTTLIAIAYRGFPLSVWTVDQPRLVNRCKRRLEQGKSPNHAWTSVDRLLWHPKNGQILGIYKDGSVFKWHPHEQIHQELKAEVTESPSEIQCSPDGTVFATSDVNGAVKLYNFHLFAMIYQLSSEDMVTALCFSPDSRRFYDIRGSYCNVWEPNSLLRLSNFDGQRDEAGSEAWSETDVDATSQIVSFDASEAWDEALVPITALAVRQKGRLCCVGNDEGLVELIDIHNLKKMQVANSDVGMSIGHLAWADDGTHFAYLEIGTRLVVKAVESRNGKSNSFGWGARSVMDVKIDLELGGAYRVLLSPDSRFVLVTSHQSAQLWSIEDQVICGTYHGPGSDIVPQWVNDPTNSDQLLAFLPTKVTAYSWSSLKELIRWRLEPPQSTSPDSDNSDEDKPGLLRSKFNHRIHPANQEVIASQTKSFILIFSSVPESRGRRRSQLHILAAASLHSDSSRSQEPLATVPIPVEIAASIERPLDVLGNDRLVYLDDSFWVCSWRLGHPGGSSALLKHFFLPHDWVNAESLDLCRVMANGTFLCPRKGEVAVIKSDLGSDW